MSGDHDLGGDYGYDLVQEAVAAIWTPQVRRPVSATMGTAGGTAMDPCGDYGYDQAHEG